MQVLAQSQRRLYLIETNDSRGVVVDVPAKTVSPEMSLAAWESMGARRWVKAEEGSRTSRLALELAEQKVNNKSYGITLKASDCGAHGGPGGGFSPGNSCAEGRGGAGTAEKEKPKTPKKQAIEKHREDREKAKEDKLKKTLKDMDSRGVEKNTDAFNGQDESEKNLQRFDDTDPDSEVKRDHGGYDKADIDDSFKASYLRCHDVASDAIDKAIESYPELMVEGKQEGDLEVQHAEIREAQADQLAKDMVNLIEGANRNLIEKGIMVDATESMSSVEDYAKFLIDTYSGDMEMMVQELKMNVAENLSTHVSISDAVQRVEEFYRESGAGKPDFSELLFRLSNMDARQENRMPLEVAQQVLFATGIYNVKDGYIGLNTYDAVKAMPDEWTMGSSGKGMVGTVVHEMGHYLHHRKLMNKNVKYTSASARDITSAGNVQRTGKTGSVGSMFLSSLTDNASKKWSVSRGADPDNWSDWTTVFEDKFGDTRRKVGGYGGTNNMEFVAEAFAMRVLKPELWESLDDDVKELYEILEGP